MWRRSPLMHSPFGQNGTGNTLQTDLKGEFNQKYGKIQIMMDRCKIKSSKIFPMYFLMNKL